MSIILKNSFFTGLVALSFFSMVRNILMYYFEYGMKNNFYINPCCPRGSASLLIDTVAGLYIFIYRY